MHTTHVYELVCILCIATLVVVVVVVVKLMYVCILQYAYYSRSMRTSNTLARVCTQEERKVSFRHSSFRIPHSAVLIAKSLLVRTRGTRNGKPNQLVTVVVKADHLTNIILCHGMFGTRHSHAVSVDHGHGRVSGLCLGPTVTDRQQESE